MIFDHRFKTDLRYRFLRWSKLVMLFIMFVAVAGMIYPAHAEQYAMIAIFLIAAIKFFENPILTREQRRLEYKQAEEDGLIDKVRYDPGGKE